ncbi:IS630 family transposase [Kitasatospora sp. NPDC101155]|uniref:IS630 family transposase n=1 Tax=Kitasatospora sp. NPDC101155 TaxID=3364097 RepID=UPI0038108B13
MSSSPDVPVRRRGPALEPLLLSDDDRAVMTRWARRATSAQALALRARIVLACDGPGVPSIVGVARELGIAADTARKWRRLLAEGLDGLANEPRPGRPPTIAVDEVEAVVVATLEEIPKNATHWSRSSMAARSGLSKSTVGRIWRKFQLKPHLADTFKLSTDPLFVEKVHDVVGLYFDPPEGAVVLSVDEKSQVQALNRSQPVLPMMPGMPERRTHDYVRNGLTTLFAAFDTSSGKVITSLHRRHRAAEFRKFLVKIDQEVPEGLDIHLICDNFSPHLTTKKCQRVGTWAAANNVEIAYTPTNSSWLNRIEAQFTALRYFTLDGTDHASHKEQGSMIRRYIIWRNRHADDQRLRAVVDRANAA